MYIQDKRNPNKHIQSSHDMHNKLAFIKTKPPANKKIFFISNIIKYIQLEYRKCNRAAEDLTERKSVKYFTYHFNG